MNGINFFNDSIEKALLDLHTAYLAKIISTNGTTAKIQPLGMLKEVGKVAETKSPLEGVPIIRSARYKLSIVNQEPEYHAISVGDIVVCLCCERDITEAKKGKNSVPTLGHHKLSDSIIIGIL